MPLYETLFQIARAIQSQDDTQKLPALLLDKALAYTGAKKGFIVVQEAGRFREKYQVHFDTSSPGKQFSSSLVRRVIRSGELYVCDNIMDDKDLGSMKSVRGLGPCAVLVAPLAHQGTVNAVIYLERTAKSGPFPADAVTFIQQFSEMAGATIYQALEQQQLLAFKKKFLARNLPDGDFTGIIGNHPSMQTLYRQVIQVAATDATVLIRGETGSGKEMFARAVFANSTRKKKPFATIHCGALPETLFESELFGHTRGAFTGAAQNRLGRVAAADGGTLFFDEVAEIPMASQAKLLRFFQFGEYQRLGSDQVQKADVRIVAATHRNLEDMIKAGTFREDLYYRLKVFALEIPPLRQRKSDIPLLVDFFREQFARKGGTAPEMSRSIFQALERYHFPGNVRELGHLLERAFVLSGGGLIELEDLPHEIQEAYFGDPQAMTQDGPRFQDYTKDELQAARTPCGGPGHRRSGKGVFRRSDGQSG